MSAALASYEEAFRVTATGGDAPLPRTGTERELVARRDGIRVAGDAAASAAGTADGPLAPGVTGDHEGAGVTRLGAP